jgi:hypothetical protein
MPRTNIKSLNYGDNQNQLIDKLNNNFDEVIEFHGGSQGLTGPDGPKGAIGEMGPPGSKGITGPRGSKWFVNNVAPIGGTAFDIYEGDYWVNSTSGEIYIFTSSGWVDTTYNLNSSSSIFQRIDSLYAIGTTGYSIVENQQYPKNYTFVVADTLPESQIINETLSKFVISTNPTVNADPLLEFSKSNIESGALSDYSLHPVFKWKNFSTSDNSLNLEVPGGVFQIGASGDGFAASFDSLNVNPSTSFQIDSTHIGGATSGIYATGGFNFSTPSGNLIFTSSFMNITGGSGTYSKPMEMNAPQVTASVPSVEIYGTNPAGDVDWPTGLRSSRSGDSLSTLSNSVYHFKLENTSATKFYLNTKGKLKANKVDEGLTIPPTNTPTIASGTGSSSRPSTSWYFLAIPGSPSPLLSLTDGNTIIVAPGNINQYSDIGVCFNTDDYGWGSTGGLQPGQSIDIKFYMASDNYVGYWDNFTNASNYTGVRYLGIGTYSGGSSTVTARTATFPTDFRPQAIDFTISREVSGSTKVYYKAYSSSTGAFGPGATGGYFTF